MEKVSLCFYGLICVLQTGGPSAGTDEEDRLLVDYEAQEVMYP